MKLIKKQELYMLMVHHERTLQGAFLWWFLNKNKNCKSFCPTCQYYFRCQEDIAMEELIEK